LVYSKDTDRETDSQSDRQTDIGVDIMQVRIKQNIFTPHTETH